MTDFAGTGYERTTARQLRQNTRYTRWSFRVEFSYLNNALEDHFIRSRTLSQPLTAIFIDIDRFKQINDTYGHHVGDAVLVSISRTIQSATRNCDTVARYGGDEFVVLLNNAAESVGGKIAERIRAEIAGTLHDVGDGKKIQVTVSSPGPTRTKRKKAKPTRISSTPTRWRCFMAANWSRF